MIFETFGAYMQRARAPNDTFFRNHERNRLPEMSPSYLQNIPTYYLSRKHKLSIPFVLGYFCTIDFVEDILRPSRECLVHDRNVHKIFQP